MSSYKSDLTETYSEPFQTSKMERFVKIANGFWIRYCLRLVILSRDRSSRPEVFYKKGVPRNFAKFTGKHLCQSLFFNKVAARDLQLY